MNIRSLIVTNVRLQAKEEKVLLSLLKLNEAITNTFNKCQLFSQNWIIKAILFEFGSEILFQRDSNFGFSDIHTRFFSIELVGDLPSSRCPMLY